MHNQGSTCYASSSVQIMHHLDPIRKLLLAREDIIGKPTEQSGRNAREILPSSFKLTKDTPEATVMQWSAQHMQNAQDLYSALAKISRQLANLEHSVNSQYSRELFSRIQAINPVEWKHATNDSADLFRNLLDNIILVTDDSVPSARDGISKLRAQQDDNLASGKPDSLQDASVAQWLAWSGKGRESPGLSASNTSKRGDAKSNTVLG